VGLRSRKLSDAAIEGSDKAKKILDASWLAYAVYDQPYMTKLEELNQIPDQKNKHELHQSLITGEVADARTPGCH
jgi:hypothetical protein